MRRVLLAVLIIVAYQVTFPACKSRWERGGKCWDTPDKGGQPVGCPPPGTGMAADAGIEVDDSEDEFEPDAGAGGHR